MDYLLPAFHSIRLCRAARLSQYSNGRCASCLKKLSVHAANAVSIRAYAQKELWGRPAKSAGG